MNHMTDQFFRFGNCVLDEPRHQLWVNHQPVALQPRAHALLAHLLRHPGVTFTKAELLGAIWPADQVANEVLSGTVHRLRQALRDAAPEVQIKTVFGVGYRLDAVVRRLDAPPPPPGDEGPLAVLPVVDDTADPTLGGVGEGLACLVHYQLSRLPHLVLLPLSESLATPADGTPANGPAEAEGTPRRTLRCRLSRAGEDLLLQAELGTPGQAAWHARFRARDPSELAGQLAQALGSVRAPTAQGAALERDLVLSEVAALEAKCQIADALARLEAWLGPRDPDVEEALMLARLLRMRGLLRKARSVADRSLQNAAGTDRAWLLMERVWIDSQGGGSAQDLHTVSRELDRLVASLVRAPLPLRALALSIAAVTDMGEGHRHEALTSAERSVALADRSGDPSAAVRTRLRLAWVQLVADNQHASLAVAEQACRIAHRHALDLLEAMSWLQIVQTHLSGGRLSQARDAADRCLALSPLAGDLRLHVLARKETVAIARKQGRVADAQATTAELMQLKGLHENEGLSLTLELSCALTHRAAGRVDLALAALEPGITDGRLQRQGLMFRAWHLRRHAELLYLAGRVDEAEAVFRQVDDGIRTAGSLLLAALRAFCLGRRSECVATLFDALRESGTGNENARIRMSLAWMLLEDGEIDKSARLLDELDALCAEQPQVPLLRYGIALCRGEAALEEGRWRRLVLAVPMVAYGHPWFADLSTAAALMTGRPRRLPDFLVPD